MAADKLTDYVQFYTTRVEPSQSQGEIIATLHRYGASGFGFRRRGSVVEVTFHIPLDGGADRTVSIPLDIDRVHERLGRQMVERSTRRHDLTAADRKRAASREQSERVAWRVLLQWINAALSAVAIGAQTIDEAFYAHSIVETTDGQTGRLIDYMNTLERVSGTPGRLPELGQPFSDQRALPPSGSTS